MALTQRGKVVIGVVAAAVVGVLAVGLHQVVYHPLFAGPVLFFGLVATAGTTSAVHSGFE